jgi:hypothetical protein
MILHQIQERSAKWDTTANTWWVGETTLYQWNTMKNEPASPVYKELKDALQWIIKHDETNTNLVG